MYFDETAWVAIAFILFIALVWKKGSKAITSTLDNRSLLIQEELYEAKSLKEQALEELKESLQIQKNSSDEFEKIINEAKDTANKIIKDAEKKSLEIIKRREEQARQKISTYETEAINDIKKISTTVAIQSARTFIQTNLDKKQNISLIKNASNEIKSKLIN